MKLEFKKILPILSLLFVVVATPTAVLANKDEHKENHGFFVSQEAHEHEGGKEVSKVAKSDIGKHHDGDNDEDDNDEDNDEDDNPSSSPTVSPTPNVSPSPSVSPSPDVSPSPEVSPSPDISPSPDVSPSPSPAVVITDDTRTTIQTLIDGLQSLIDKLKSLL